MQPRKYFKTIVVGPGLLLALIVLGTAMRKRVEVRPGGGEVGALSGSVGKGMVVGGMDEGEKDEGGTAERGGSIERGTDERGGSIAWLSVAQASDKLQQEKRPVLIDLYTTWCGWCREMDRKTYSNKKVAAYLEEKFYTVKVDAETHEIINWQGRSYAFDPQYRSNMFAIFLTHGRLEFPTTIIIPPGDAPQAIPGYMEPKELELLVKYFGDGAYKTEGFDVFQKNFKGSW